VECITTQLRRRVGCIGLMLSRAMTGQTDRQIDCIDLLYAALPAIDSIRLACDSHGTDSLWPNSITATCWPTS